MAPDTDLIPVNGDYCFETFLRLFDTTDLLGPATSEQVADMLGMANGTLKNLRCAGSGPPGYVRVPGIGKRYRCKLDVLRWWWEQHRQATLEPSERRAA